ncbi:MAG: pitrilysin family protein [Acidobacteriota bacterium]|nr:pitrilysin family protein [Acidobacteriota bacterium]
MTTLMRYAGVGIVCLGLAMFVTGCGGKKTGGPVVELLPIEGNPLVSLRIVLNVGSAHDPAGKEGLAQLTLNLLANGGSRDLTFQEISERFYPMAARLGLRVDKEMSAFSGTVHVDNLEAYYAILRGMLLEPGFREEDFTRIKTNQVNFLERTLVNNMDEQFGKEILNLMLYEDHPYGRNEAGTVESVSNLTLDDVRSFYKEHFLRGNFTIGLAGGYPDGFVEKVTADFAALPEGRTPQLVLPETRMPSGLEFMIAEKQTPATAISMGFPVKLTRADKDFFALWIAGAHFGEHRQSLSLLFQKIREERGQNYGNYAYIEHFIQGRDKFPATNYARQQQYFSIWIRPLANSNRHFVVRQALRELRKLVEEGIPEERFELTRTYLLNYTRLYAQTLDERIGWQIDSRHYGTRDFLDDVQKRLPRISREDVNRAIRKHLNFDNVMIAVITEDAESLRDALIADTPSPISYANPNMPAEILQEDLVIQSYALGVRPETVRIAPATAFFRKAGLPME